MDILSFDGEATRLHGPVFAIGGVVLRDGVVRERFFARCPPPEEPCAWVQENVLPVLDAAGIASLVTHPTPRAMRDAFWQWLKAPRDPHHVVVDCGWPVEAGLLSACIADEPARSEDDQGREGQGPYPLHEVATLLFAAGHDPMAKYAARLLPDVLDASHHPVFDAWVSARCAEFAIATLEQRGDLSWFDAMASAAPDPVPTQSPVDDRDASFATMDGRR